MTSSTQRLDEIFDLRYGHSLELNALQTVAAPAGVNFVSRAMRNNGVTARVSHVGSDVGKAGELTVALSGNGVLSTFVQPEPFVTGFHVMILTAKNPDMSTVEKLWWGRCIWENRYRYSFGRQANRTLASLQVPKLVPAWVGDAVMPTMDGLARAAGPARPFKDPLIEGWEPFRVGDLFTISRGKYVPAVQQRPGTTAVVTSSARNNGISKYLALPPLFEGGQITVARNGSVCEAFFQPGPFFASDDVFILDPIDPLTRLAGIFIATVLRLEKHRYNYGRKLRIPLLQDTLIRLPADDDGRLDVGYIEEYMRGLAFSAVFDDDAPQLEVAT